MPQGNAGSPTVCQAFLGRSKDTAFEHMLFARGLADLGSAKILVHTGHFRLRLPPVIATVTTFGPGLLASTVT